MSVLKIQQGVGLVEVLVALVLLAIGILGFVALQYRAIESSAEASSRVQAMNLARDLSERIRANDPRQITVYADKLNAASQVAAVSSCVAATTCTSAQMASDDAGDVIKKANDLGFKISMPTCFGVLSGRYCIYVAWGETTATDGHTTTDCTKNGMYVPQSTCVIMETY